jgi:hypothetical protein
MDKKLESIKQLSNCDDMHIYVKPIRDYIQELEDDYEIIMDLISGIDDDLLYTSHYKLWQIKTNYNKKEVEK